MRGLIAATSLVTLAILGVCVSSFAAAQPTAQEPGGMEGLLKDGQRLSKEGNFRDAANNFRRLVLELPASPKIVAEAFESGIQTISRYSDWDDVDQFRQAALTRHRNNPRLLTTAAQTLLNSPSHGTIVDGEFRRGQWGETHLNVFDADRAWAVRWLFRAVELDRENNTTDIEAARTVESLANTLLRGRSGNMVWRLQETTDLETIPNYNDQDAHVEPGGQLGWPVDGDNDPLSFRVSNSWDAAANDGERYRWALAEQVRLRADWKDRVALAYADFLRRHLGVGTLGNLGRNIGDGSAAEDILSLRTLSDDETIARLATGVRRLTLPENLDFIALYKSVENERQRVDRLSTVYLDRQQYPTAAETLAGFTKNGTTGGSLGERYRQIVGNLGQLQPFQSQPAGQPATLQYRFRNGKRVDFEAQPVDVKSLIADWQAAVTGSGNQAANAMQQAFGNLGQFLVGDPRGLGIAANVATKSPGQKYLGETVAEWSVDLEPRPQHLDTTTTIETPLSDGGVYLVTARMADGNVSRVVVWIDDAALLKKPLAEKNKYLLYVADAATGQPIAGSTIDLFGWRQGDRPKQVVTQRLSARANPQGIVEQVLPERMQWLISATTPDGRLAFLNPEWMWSLGRHRPDRLSRTTPYGVTDRPIYRPGHIVHSHVWLRDARYDLGDVSNHAGASGTLVLRNPQGDEVFSRAIALDEFGGAGAEWTIPEDAKLGRYGYQLNVGGRNYGAGGFRVEEYRKPDFEVMIDKPSGPITLGDEVDVTIRASYYAGGAVSNGRVSIKVERTEYSETFYPMQPWDWLYGNGYGWKWFDGYGSFRFNPWWRRSGPPELVLQQEVDLAADGTAKVTIDTELAKTLFGDQSQKYQITAEVTDVSRRVVAASGSVVAAAKPFEVQVWSRRGYANVGERLPVQVTARRVGGGTVDGNAIVQLVRLTRDGDDIQKSVIGEQHVALVAGTADVDFPIAEAGLYRIEAGVTEGDATELGSWEFVARGETVDDPIDDPLSLTPDKREYAVGDTAKLLLTSTQAGTQVLVFERPEGGRYGVYEVKRLDGAATLIEVPITQGDMPNIYVEAVAVVDGETETVVAELFVPPTSRALDVSVEADRAEVGPGEEVSLTIRAHDADGNPHAGAVAVTVYDRSLDAIARGGGSGDIRNTFWSWRRYHYVQLSHSLGRSFSETLKRKEIRLQMLGRFGGLSDVVPARKAKGGFAGGGFGGGGFGGGGVGLGMRSRMATGNAPMPMSAPMAGEAEMMDGAMPELAAAKAMPADKADAGGDESAVDVRESFADTAFWTGIARTDADGVAHVTFTMPENLTAWSANAWVVAPGTRVGQGSTGIVTSKDVLVRMIAPRFLVETDTVVLSGVVQNQTDHPITASVSLSVDESLLRVVGDTTQSVTVPANSTARADWEAVAIGEGDADLTLIARSSAGDDAMKINVPVKVHGFLRTESWAGIVRDADSKSIQIVVPNDRRPAQSLISVRVSPTVAGAIVESLPYLIDYPYGCTEQTLNRFLPAVVTGGALASLSVSLEEVAGATAKLDPNVPDRVLVDAPTAVLSDETLDDVVEAGVERLLQMQLSDGGWGWFSGHFERSYPHTTAIVVRGLQRAAAVGETVPDDALTRGRAWLERYRAAEIKKLQNHENDIKDVPRKAHASHTDAIVEMTLSEAGRQSEDMRGYLFRDRLKLSPVGLAMVGLAFSDEPDSDQFKLLVTNLEQFFVRDDENATAYLKTPDRFGYWWWYGDDVEANAYALKLFVKAMPDDPRVSGLARYLLNNRRNATYWKSTRDTAIAVEALAEYLEISGELEANVTLEVLVDGRSLRKVHVTRDNLFTFDGVVELEGDAVSAGLHTVELRRDGEGPLYYAVQSTNFTLENFIPKAGLELKTERRFWKLTPREQSTTAAGGRGQVVDIDVDAYDRTPLAQKESVPSGTLVEVELLVESKNDYEYLLLEDLKPAGFETVEGLSGYRPGFGGAYVEFRDDRVALFFRRVNRGTLSAKYRVRAEQPGSFSALPAKIQAMYSPSLVGNSDEQKLGVTDVQASSVK